MKRINVTTCPVCGNTVYFDKNSYTKYHDVSLIVKECHSCLVELFYTLRKNVLTFEFLRKEGVDFIPSEIANLKDKYRKLYFKFLSDWKKI